MNEEFAGPDFNPVRLEERFKKTPETLSRDPARSIFGSCGTRAESKAVYRLPGNEKFDGAEIKRCYGEAALRRISQNGNTILAVRDTTGINYAGHKKTEGPGYNCDKTLGINPHACLTVTPGGIVLGILDQGAYTGENKKDGSATRDEKKTRPVEEKESHRRLSTIETGNRDIPEGIKVSNVCDREGDIYELFEKADVTGKLFLIRIVQNRITVKREESEKVIDAIRKEPPKGAVTAAVPRDSGRNIKAREAAPGISFKRFNIKKPHALDGNQTIKRGVTMNVIYVKERRTDKDIEPVERILAANGSVTNFEEAYEKVCCYVQRLKTERFHYVLKSGCKAENIQERAYEKTTRLLLTYSFIAVTLLNMAYIARVNPDLPCSVLFDEDERKILFCMANKTKIPPKEVYTIKGAVTFTGWPGGPKRAPGDGPPGVKTIWKGLTKLHTMPEYRELLAGPVGQG